MKRPSIQTNNHDQIIRNLQYSYPSSPFGDWTTFDTNNPHGYFSWDKSIYPDGIRFNNIGSGGWYYNGEWAELSQTVTFEYPQTRTIYIGNMGTARDNQSVEIWVGGTRVWHDYDSGTPTQIDIYFPTGTYEFKIRYYVKYDCYGAPACNLNHVYRIIDYSPPPPPPGNLTINITPSDAIYNVIDSLGTTVISNVLSGTTVQNLIPDTYSSTLSRNGYEDKLLSNIVIGPGETKILTDTLTPLPPSTGDVCIKSNPPGASVTIDGTLQPGKITTMSETVCILNNTVIGLTPGTNNHSYEINLTGYQPKSGIFSIIAGTLTEIDVGNLVLIPVSAGSSGFTLLSLGLLFGLILIKKKCGDRHTKEECEKAGCQWKDGKCIERI